MMAGYEKVRELRGDLPAIRCTNCNRLLYRGVAQTIEIKCPKCGVVQLFKGGERRWSKPGGALFGGVPRVVTDSAGRMVAIPGRPERVIALNASNLGLYYASGGNVVGRASTNMLPPDMAEQVRSIPTVGMPPCPDVARIIAMKPDLVLGMHAPMHHSLAAVLEKTGIPVLLQALEHYTDVLRILRLYGELSGNPERAAGKIEEIETRRRELVRQHWGNPSPKVLILWEIADGLYTALSHSFVGDLVKRLGGVNVADIAIDENLSYVPFRLEAFASFQPDVILLVNHGVESVTGTRFYQELTEQPAWQQLNAVRQQAVYQLPFHLFAVNPGPQLGDALGVLADFLYKGHVL
ncbi:High-affinity heme uptake system protein IsdE precursor [Sporomusa ovata DSM 2662]|uniref:Vitamin B12 ABC transporter, B12-binding component BtuF n=1 Tax=Sporomusa ovata TaxID=2378 RepID=A0A0U1KZA8_9FIRM|nr:ABC transporter substrate-binding protein [Sporomusa ovata]EQB27816.1 ABC-type Fe3+-hydroxamate transport system, periplasmic component [Sporomusa ovata DSM 2662]CQR72748.1 Vitamin B12 ABC transporter, B12-binding component BtuF [Sporomusa ovata]